MPIDFIKPSQLPAAASVGADAAIPFDNGVAVEKATPKQIVDAGRPIASESQAVAGVSNTTAMTPLAVRQALDNYALLVNEDLDSVTALRLNRFGAVGDAVLADDGTVASGEDDTAAIQDAVDWMLAKPGRKIVGDPGAIYRISDTISGIGSVLFDLNGAMIVQTVNKPIFDLEAPLFGPFDLASDYVPGDPIDVTGMPFPEAPQPGLRVKIVGFADDPANRDQGGSTQRYWCGEYFTVGAGSTTTSIVPSYPLTMTRGIDPVQVTGPEPDVEAYTTAYNARMVYADPDAYAYIINGTLAFEQGHSADNWNADTAILRGYTKSGFSRVTAQDGYGAAFKPYGTIGSVIAHCKGLRLEDNTPNGQFGYVVGDAGEETQVIGLKAASVRHAYTTAEPTFTTDQTDPRRLIGIGRVRNPLIVGGVAHGGTAAHWDTHHGAQNAVFRDNVSRGGGEAGLALRGRENVVSGLVIDNSLVGVRVFTDFAASSGADAGDGTYTAGDTNRDITNATLSDLTVECDHDPLVVSHGITDMHGLNLFRSTDHRFVENTGGVLRITDKVRFTVTGDGAGGADTDGIFHLYAGNPKITANAVPIPTIIIEQGARVEIDARTATAADVAVIEAAAGTQMIIRGTLIVRTPGTWLRSRGSGSIIIEGTGYYEHEQVGVQTRGVYGARKDVTPAYDFESTNETIADGALLSQTSITTNDASGRKERVADTVFAGDGTVGYAGWGVRTTNASESIRMRFYVQASGDVDFRQSDGVTVGAKWSPSLNRFIGPGIADKALSPGMFGWTSSQTPAEQTAAINAMMVSARDSALPWRMVGVFDIEGTVTAYTAGDASSAILRGTYGGQSAPLFVVAPNPADTFASDAALLTAANAIITAGGWRAGVRELPTLAAWGGKSFRLASTSLYLDRDGGDADDYRYDLTIEVLSDGEGTLASPLPFDIPSGVTLTVAEGQTVRRRIEVGMPTIELTTGSTARTGSLIDVTRSNTVLRGGSLIDSGGAEHDYSARIFKATGVTWYDLDLPRAVEHGNAYGLGAIFASGIVLHNLRGSGCKRQISADYVHDIELIGCHCSDGTFGHMAFDVRIVGGVVSCDDPGLAPILGAGGNVTVTGARITRKGKGPIITSRDDLFELRGAVRLVDCDITIDLSGESAGNADCPLVLLDSPSGAHDFGRDVHFPEKIEISGNNVRFIAGVATPRALLFSLSVTKNASDSVILNTDLIVERNTILTDAGAVVACRINGIRETNWSGAGLRARIRDLTGPLTIYWAARSGHITPTAARATWDVKTGAAVTLTTDPEATVAYDIDCSAFTLGSALGVTSLVGDEVWFHRLFGGPRHYNFTTIADDAAASVSVPSVYGRATLVQRNAQAGGAFATFFVDLAGTDGITPGAANAVYTYGYYATALTGTTGTDVQLNIGADISTGNRLIHIENRTGAPIVGITIVWESIG